MKQSNLTIVRWNRNYDFLKKEEPESLYFVNFERNFVGKFNDSWPDLNRMRHLSGIPMVSGYRDGAMVSALYNRPISVIALDFDVNRMELRGKLELTKQVFVFRDGGCLQGFRAHGQLMAECLTEETMVTDLSLMTFVYDEQLVEEAGKDGELDDGETKSEILIVSDSGNHCIRILDLKERVVRTLVGQCGQSGFMDGMRGNSLLNSPKSIGIDRAGRIYIHDDGNSSIRRLILPTEFKNLEEFIFEAKLVTLVNGTCYSLPESYQSAQKRQLSGDD